MYALVLGLHICTAILTGMVILYALYVLKFNKTGSYHLSALILGFVASLEVVTGVLLAELSPTISAIALSTHMLEYLGVCISVELWIFMRIKKNSTTVVTI